MRIAHIVGPAILLLSVLTGCARGGDVEGTVYVGDGGTLAPTGDVAPPLDTPTPPEPVDTKETPVETLPPATAEPIPAVTPPTDAYTFDPTTWDQTLTVLDSFRQKIVLAFTADETGVDSRVTYEGEVTVDPSALHFLLRVEGQGSAQLPSNQVEVIWIGDQVWVKAGRQPWAPVPESAVESQYGGQVIGVGDLLPFVQQAGRLLPNEHVNGIPCQHYVYNGTNLQAEAGMSSAQGDIWVAEQGGYVVRLTMNGQGAYYGTYDSSGTLTLVYDLFDVDAPIDISPPR